ncbi:MAG: outer membrane beta-barrel protein [Candidatus Omnitrophota bacterium]
MLRGGVSETYDDNVTYVKVGKIKDYITRPWVGLSASYDNKTTVFTASGRYYHEFYANKHGFNNNGGDFTASVNSELSKFDRISVSDSFSRTEEPRSFEDVFGRTGGRYSSTRNRVNLGYARDISEHFGASLRYSNEYNTYSRTDIPKSYLNTAGVEGAYIVGSDLTFIGAYDFTARDFSPGANTRVNTLSGGLRKYITKQLYFDGVGGVDFINSFSGRRYTKPMVQVSLSDDFSERTRASLYFSKRFDTVSYSQDLFDQWRVSGALSHEIFQKLRGTLSAFYGRGEYIGASSVTHLIGSSAGLTYDINDHWKATADYSYTHETSSVPLGGYLKNRVTLGLAAEF